MTLDMDYSCQSQTEGLAVQQRPTPCVLCPFGLRVLMQNITLHTVTCTFIGSI
jgi:hypothetical protein